MVLLSLPIVFGLGVWGFSDLRVTPRLDLLETLYRSLKLYYFDLGPIAGSGEPRHVGWQIWLAFLVALLVLARGALALSRRSLRSVVMRNWLRDHVIVCGAGIHGARLVEELAPKREVVLIDPDPQAFGMQSRNHPYEWRRAADARRRQSLIDAGIHRARWVIALAGDDLVNSQIVSTVRELDADRRLRADLRVLVQAEDPVLARFLEETALGARPDAQTVTPFSANAIAADALIADSPGGEELGDILLAGDHPVIDALVLIVLRRRRVRWLLDLEQGQTSGPPAHVSLFGPAAAERAARLRRLWRPEPHVMTLEARDSEFAEGQEASLGEWLRRPGRADQAIVACIEEVDSVRLTLRLCRVLGDATSITRVNTSLRSDIDEHIEERTAHDEQLSTTRAISIADLACDPDRMSRQGGRDRLRAALNADPSPAEELFARRAELELRSDSAWRIRPSERALSGALIEPVPLSALVRAGLRVELGTAGNLRHAVRRLMATTSTGPSDPDGEGPAHELIAGWCELVRHVSARSRKSEVTDWLREPTGDRVGDMILLAGRGALGDAEALQELRCIRDLEGGGDPLRRHNAGATRVVIFGGPAGSSTAASDDALRRMLEPALRGFDGVALSGGTAVGLPGVVGRLARAHAVDLIGYCPPGRADPALYESVRETPDTLFDSPARPFSVREPLVMWTDILAAGIRPHEVDVVVFHGGRIAEEEMLLARALGARVAWVDHDGGAAGTLDDSLPLGVGSVVELPADPMTIRAFLVRPALEADVCERLGKHLHDDYRRRQRARKRVGDPALASWDDLLESLKASNRAQAADIPNKLALIGRRIKPNGPSLSLSDDEVELLAEAEHGRWTVERVLAGWELGDRAVEQGATPHLRPWAELSEANREFDREAVRGIGAALQEAGLGAETVDSVDGRWRLDER